MNSIYRALKKAVIRTPLFPLEKLKKTDEILESKYFMQGLYLSSPLIHGLYKKGNLSPKMKNTIHKYAHRSAFRCTPYGVFAGNSIAQVKTGHNEVNLMDISQYSHHLSLNIECIRNLVELLKNNAFIHKNINYFTNESIYLIGNRYNYIECHFTNNQCIYNHSIVNKTDIIEIILQKARYGLSIEGAVNIIKNIDSSIQEEDALGFVEEMIESQLLKSDLEINILNEDPLNDLIYKLRKIGENSISSQLLNINSILKSSITINSISYKNVLSNITSILENIGLSYKGQNLINVNLYKPTKSATISLSIASSIEKLLTLLVRLQSPVTNNRIIEFINAFEQKYEDNEIGLAEALDNEYGIGYPLNYYKNEDLSELLNDLIIPNRSRSMNERYTNYNKVDSILINKLFKCIKDHENIVNINDSDFNGIDYKGNFPSTIYVLCSILKNDQIFIKAIGGISAGNIIGRFATDNQGIKDILKEICIIEKKYTTEDVILAEVANTPDGNATNIVCKVKTRDYIIPIISNNKEPKDDTIIPISDITISLQNGKLILKSKKLNKQIIPRFTNAYNYDRSQLPIIRFLHDFQYIDISDSLSLKWHEILQNIEYLPRIQYNNCILAKQRWILYREEFKSYFENSDYEWSSLINKYTEIKGIPKDIVVVEFDNELYINLVKIQDCLLLKSILKKNEKLIVEEFIYSIDDSIVNYNGEHYANETILFFKRDEVE